MKPAEKMHSELDDKPSARNQDEAMIDPVCGMAVDSQSAAGSFDYKGKTYYFCSTHCLQRFREDPERFVNKVAEASQNHLRERVGFAEPVANASDISRPPAYAGGSDKIGYTCPMHPEVREPKPGSCPKCGMSLEPVTATAPKEKVEYTCPMHPQIIRDAPGFCPICGMTLEPRTVTGEEENAELVDMKRRFWVS
ncbi:MAG: YHS domain-containing protein, partial [Acidobacteriota bacterium]|nr:YHS domain-containing protein [Acidobacteriota bacterium]